MRTNEFGQTIGDALPDFTPGLLPAIERIEGRYTVIERLSKKNMEQIFIRSTGRTLQQRCGPFCSKALPAMRRSGTAY